MRKPLGGKQSAMHSLPRMTLRKLVAFGIAALSAISAHAQSSPKTPDWSSDYFLLGAWSCELARPGAQPDKEQAVYSLSPEGHWLKLRYTLTPSDPKAPTLTTDAYETFDQRLKRWVYISLRSDGVYGISYSDGWKGATKVYTPPAYEKQGWRLTATKVSDTEFTEQIQTTGANGEWHAGSPLRCKKAD
jgi:hypothetical protein